jgi:hypothetical protein
MIGDYLSLPSTNIEIRNRSYCCSRVVLPYLLATSNFNKTPNFITTIIQSFCAFITSITAERTSISAYVQLIFALGPAHQVDELVAAPLGVCSATSDCDFRHDELIREWSLESGSFCNCICVVEGLGLYDGRSVG